MTVTPSPQSVVSDRALEQIAFNLCSLHDFPVDFVKANERFARSVITEYLRAAPAPSSLAGGEDSAFKVATDLHAAYEALIYGLPKYLEAKNLTDEESMIREAWIKLDVTAHRLAALSPEAPTRVGVREALLNAVMSLEELAKAWPQEHLPSRAMCVRMADAINGGNAALALTPRHEAPAEGAGEMDDDDESTYAPSVAGLSDYLWNQAQAADSVEGRCILEMWREAVDALRARSSAPEAREGEAESLFKALRDESWDLRCFSVPTGGDDADIGWRVVGHWQAEPCERTVAEVFYDDPAEAVRQALATLKAEGC